ncbi:ATP-binding protein [Paramagnetospirillum magneticum]|uniref:histidine kinase n=1 Tax=Paramagnetospirillum magneticum (strain ATCC 700264 / AMB-1) TaxID=342108 RepID=Q2W8B0_PARM1|nr:ATP-binding protein [Paramagnetospirillum magneticum]BAE49915.1 Signal transduction histidine kinase [Paramagnetospirillum magneticum AMB-1]
MISRISVSGKLLLIYALDMVAVIFLGFSLAEEKYISINFARKEVAGNVYIDTVRDALFAIAEDGTVTVGQLAALERAEGLYGPEMSSRIASDDLLASSRPLATASPQRTDAAALKAVTSARALISRIGDQSNLILDPDLDSYYSMSLVLLRFPELVDLLAQIRAQAHRSVHDGAISADDRTEFLILEGRLTNVIKGIEGDRLAGYSGNPDGSLERALKPAFALLDTALSGLLADLRASIIDQSGPIQAEPVSRAIDTSLQATKVVWVQTSSELNRLLNIRIEGFFRRMWEHFGLAGALLSVILILVLLVARRIAVPIGHLAEVAEAVRQTNDYDRRAKWDSGDEIGRLVDAFNTMLERLQAEGLRREELAAQTRAAEAQRDLLEAIPTPLTVSRLSDHSLLHVNQPASLLLGLLDSYDAVEDHLSAEDRERLFQQLSLHGAVNEFEVQVMGAGDVPFWALMSARLLVYQGEKALLATIIPISERKRMEDELLRAKNAAEAALSDLQQAQQSLIQAEKMASLGGLVAGVAHEINTPVGIGLTGASTLASETERLRKLYGEQAMTEEDFLDYLGVAAETARLLLANMNRAAELIHSFKQVAVDQTSAERRRFDLKTYIEEILNSLTPTIKKRRLGVEVSCPDGIEMNSYPGILSQVLTNLVMNAVVHAYEENQAGILGIRVQDLGDEVLLAFSDDGKGISAENLSRIFDPFFTTRRGNGGSGLGLHIVFNVVTGSLNGQIDVASEPGRGTTFTLRFPKTVRSPLLEDMPA